jgi:hypothetical protein
LQSIFVKEPAIALNTARQQLRDVADQDITHYCVEHRIDRTDIIAIIEECCDVPVPAGDNVLATLTDEQVVIAWASVDTNPRFRRLARE